MRSAENHRQRGPVRLLVGEGESRQGPKSADMLTSAFVESTRAPRAAAAGYPGQDDGRLLAVDSERPVQGPAMTKASVGLLEADARVRGKPIARPPGRGR